MTHTLSTSFGPMPHLERVDGLHQERIISTPQHRHLYFTICQVQDLQENLLGSWSVMSHFLKDSQYLFELSIHNPLGTRTRTLVLCLTA